MILLLAVAIWILVLVLVTGLCGAARAGEVVQQTAHTPAVAGWESSQAQAWRQGERLAISARAHAGASDAAVEPDAPSLHSRGVAA